MKKERQQSLESGRKYRGLLWTDEQREQFNASIQCEVCRRELKLHADHCRDCGMYRGALCAGCNTAEGVLRKFNATCPEGSAMRLYVDGHICEAILEVINME